MKKRFIIFLLLISLSLIFFVVREYFYFSNSDDVVTLLPDDLAPKKKPKDPGGLVLPNSDSLVYDSLKGRHYIEKKINLLTGPEDPIDIFGKQEVKAKFLYSIDEILNNIEYYENEYIDIDTKDIESSDYALPNILLTKKEKKANDNNIYVPGSNLNIIKALEDRHKVSNYNLIDKEGDGYKIQLSSAYSQNDAIKKWRYISQKHSKILGEANLVIKKIEGKNERIFFLVMAGSYESLSHAKLVCKKLSKRRKNCIITK